jgi:hypothetical protein
MQLIFLRRLVTRDTFQYTDKLKTIQISGFIQFSNGLKGGVMMNLDMESHSLC